MAELDSNPGRVAHEFLLLTIMVGCLSMVVMSECLLNNQWLGMVSVILGPYYTDLLFMILSPGPH